MIIIIKRIREIRMITVYILLILSFGGFMGGIGVGSVVHTPAESAVRQITSSDRNSEILLLIFSIIGIIGTFTWAIGQQNPHFVKMTYLRELTTIGFCVGYVIGAVLSEQLGMVGLVVLGGIILLPIIYTAMSSLFSGTLPAPQKSLRSPPPSQHISETSISSIRSSSELQRRQPYPTVVESSDSGSDIENRGASGLGRKRSVTAESVLPIPRPQVSSAPLNLGDTIVTEIKGGRMRTRSYEWFYGTIEAINSDGSYDIRHDSGELDVSVDPSMVSEDGIHI